MSSTSFANKLNLICLVLVLGLSACTTPEKTGDTPEKAFSIAEEYEKSDLYEQAIKKYQDVKNRFPYSQFAVKSELAIADVHFKSESYAEAQVHYISFKDLHPTHPRIDYVIFQIGMSFFHQLPTTIDRDLSLATDAIKYFDEVQKRFPKSQYLKDALEKRDESQKMLAEKEEYIADFYYKREMFMSALKRYENIIRQFTTGPNHAKLEAKALARAAVSARRIGNEVKMKEYRDKVIQSYPSSEEAELARKELF